MRVLVVVPTYQEAGNIATVLGQVRASLPEASILVVDDGSPDGTADIAAEAGDRLGGIEVLRRGGKEGLGSAYREGFTRGLVDGFDVLVEIDADLSHDPADLPRLVVEIEQGADLVIGSRYVAGGHIPDWSLWRGIVSRGGNRYASLMLGLPVRDATAGFRAYRAAVLRRVDLAAMRADGYAFQVELTLLVDRLGGRIVEVPITFHERQHGRSKMSRAIVAEAFVLVTRHGARHRLRRVLGPPSLPLVASAG